MSLNHEVPHHHIDHLADTVDLSADIAKLAVRLAFEDKMTEVDERLVSRDTALSEMREIAPMILGGER